jgi:hypothetical protein
MKKVIVSTLLVFSLICVSFMSYGFRHPPRPSGHHKPPGHNKPPGHHDAPFDGGASLLIAAGAAYGIKKAYNRRTTKLN